MKNIGVIVILLFFLLIGYFLWQRYGQQKIVDSGNSTPFSCQVCGTPGIHNVEENTCLEGYLCKQGKTTTASYCVKAEESVSICESSSE